MTNKCYGTVKDAFMRLFFLVFISLFAFTAYGANQSDLKVNTLVLGAPTSATKQIRFNTGLGVSSPTIRANTSTNKIQFSNDGSIYKDLGSGSGSGGGGSNLLTLNSDFESGVTLDWISSSATVSNENYLVSLEGNLKFARIVSTSGFFETSSLNIPTFLQGQDCELNFNYNQSTSGNFRVDVFTSGTVVASQTISSSTTWAAGPKIFYPCGTNTTKVRFQAINGGGTLDIDDIYLGSLRSAKNGAVITSWIPYTVTTVQGIGTLTNAQFFYRRVGENLEINGTGTAGAAVASLLQFPLPNGFTTSNSLSTGTTGVGYFYRNTGGDATLSVLAQRNLPYLLAGVQATSLAAATPANGNNVFVSGDTFTIKASVQVNGFTGSSTTFDSVCPNDMACENIFAATVNTSRVVTKASFPNFFTCTGTTTVTCTFPTGAFTVAPSCDISGDGSGHSAIATSNVNSTATQVTVNFTNQSGTNIAPQFTIVCTKASPDFKTKRNVEGYLSKIARTSGLVATRELSFAFGTTNDTTVCSVSPCTLFRNTGDVLSMTRVSQGIYTINFNAGVFSQAPTCVFTNRLANAAQENYTGLQSRDANQYTVRLTQNGNLVTDMYGDVYCFGITAQ